MSESSVSRATFDVREVRSRANVAEPEPLVIISSDSHAAAAPEDYAAYLDPGLRAAYLEDCGRWQRVIGACQYPIERERVELFDDRGALRAGGDMAYFDPYRRLREATAEGIVAEVLHQGGAVSQAPFCCSTTAKYPPELRAAGARAYNRWLHEYASVDVDRLIQVWIAYPYPDARAAAETCEMARAAGAKAVSPGLQAGVPGDPCPPLYDPFWDPFWAACQDLSLVIDLHAGFGQPQGEFLDVGEQLLRDREAGRIGSRQALVEGFVKLFDTRVERRAWIHMMLGGVLDRFPRLKVALSEIHCDWIPATLAMVDAVYARGDTMMKRPPSEYWAENFWVGASIMRFTDLEARHELGVDKLMFGSDFPHPEGSWPNTQDWLRALLKGISEPDARRILGQTVIDVYGLDAQLMQKLARIHGPSPNEVLGDHSVPDALMDEFDLRHGLRKPAEIHEDWLRSMIEEGRVGAAQVAAL